MDEQIKKNLGAAAIWIRLAYMVFFAFVIYIAMGLFTVLVLGQFLFVLFTTKPNIKLRRFSDVLCQYIAQCIKFECFVADDKPFPFDDFPESHIEAKAADAQPDPVVTEPQSPDSEATNTSATKHDVAE